MECIGAKNVRGLCLIVHVINEPEVVTPSAVARNVRAIVTLQTSLQKFVRRGAWFEEKAAEYDPDSWFPFLDDQPVTIEPGRASGRTLGVLLQYDTDRGNCYLLTAESCNHKGWIDPFFKIGRQDGEINISLDLETHWGTTSTTFRVSMDPVGILTLLLDHENDGSIPNSCIS